MHNEIFIHIKNLFYFNLNLTLKSFDENILHQGDIILRFKAVSKAHVVYIKFTVSEISIV